MDTATNVKYMFLSYGSNEFLECNSIPVDLLKSRYPMIANAFLYRVKHDVVLYLGIRDFSYLSFDKFLKNVEQETKPVSKRDIWLSSLDRCELFANMLKKKFSEFEAENVFAFVNRMSDKTFVIFPIGQKFFAIEIEHNDDTSMNLYYANIDEIRVFVETACSKAFAPKLLWEVNACKFMNEITDEILMAKMDKVDKFLADVAECANDRNKVKLPKSMAKFLMFKFQEKEFKNT